MSPDSKVDVANMGPIWVLVAPGGLQFANFAYSLK